jgi:hypothetical protein
MPRLDPFDRRHRSFGCPTRQRSRRGSDPLAGSITKAHGLASKLHGRVMIVLMARLESSWSATRRYEVRSRAFDPRDGYSPCAGSNLPGWGPWPTTIKKGSHEDPVSIPHKGNHESFQVGDRSLDAGHRSHEDPDGKLAGRVIEGSVSGLREHQRSIPSPTFHDREPIRLRSRRRLSPAEKRRMPDRDAIISGGDANGSRS